MLEEKSNLLSKQVAKSANKWKEKSGVAKRTYSVIKEVRVNKKQSIPKDPRGNTLSCIRDRPKTM